MERDSDPSPSQLTLRSNNSRDDTERVLAMGFGKGFTRVSRPKQKGICGLIHTDG
jgi:hypothetical protein